MKNLSIAALAVISMFAVSNKAEAGLGNFMYCKNQCSAKMCEGNIDEAIKCVQKCDTGSVQNCKAAADKAVHAKMNLSRQALEDAMKDGSIGPNEFALFQAKLKEYYDGVDKLASLQKLVF